MSKLATLSTTKNVVGSPAIAGTAAAVAGLEGESATLSLVFSGTQRTGSSR
jgi:hypothetical protein